MCSLTDVKQLKVTCCQFIDLLMLNQLEVIANEACFTVLANWSRDLAKRNCCERSTQGRREGVFFLKTCGAVPVACSQGMAMM